MDTATLQISSQLPQSTLLYSQVDECNKCPLVLLTEVKALPEVSSISISTVYSTDFALRHVDASEDLCRFKLHFNENGKYQLNVSAEGEDKLVSCSLHQENADTSHDANTPIYIFLGVIIGATVLWQLARWMLARYRIGQEQQFVVASESDGDSSTSSSDSTTLSKPPTSRRLQSLDTFRGLTLLLMIFVNNNGGGYWYFSHTPWNGLTIADLLFPWFIFMMGVSIAISMRSSSKKASLTRSRMMVHIIRRSILLFLFGLVINSMGYKSMEELRIASVLGRFSVGYLVVASCQLLFLHCHNVSAASVRWPFFMDIVPFWPVCLISLIFPLMHVLVTYLLPVPDCPTGYIGPGGLDNNASHFNCTGGAAGYIDRTWLGDSHIYQTPTFKTMYHSMAYDPEGILGYLSSTFLVFLGLQAGRIITVYSGHRDRLTRLASWGVALGLLAGILCQFSKNDGWIPVNKNLWSLSYVLTSAATGMLILAFLYYVIDVLGIWSGTPCFYPSVNSIVIYVGSELLDYLFPFSWHMPDTHAAQLFMALWTTALWLLISFWLYRNKIFISL